MLTSTPQSACVVVIIDKQLLAVACEYSAFVHWAWGHCIDYWVLTHRLLLLLLLLLLLTNMIRVALSWRCKTTLQKLVKVTQSDDSDHIRGWKRWFLRLWFFMFFFKNQKPRKVGFYGFYGFLNIVIFCINYALKPYSYYFLIIIWFSVYMNLYFTVFTLHSLRQYIVVF